MEACRRSDPRLLVRLYFSTFFPPLLDDEARPDLLDFSLLDCMLMTKASSPRLRARVSVLCFSTFFVPPFDVDTVWAPPLALRDGFGILINMDGDVAGGKVLTLPVGGIVRSLVGAPVGAIVGDVVVGAKLVVTLGAIVCALGQYGSAIGSPNESSVAQPNLEPVGNMGGMKLQLLVIL